MKYISYFLQFLSPLSLRTAGHWLSAAWWNLIFVFFRNFNNFKIRAACWIVDSWTRPLRVDGSVGELCPGRFFVGWRETLDFRVLHRELVFLPLSAGVYFLYRRCGFLHAGLWLCVSCFFASASVAFWCSRPPFCFSALRRLDLDLALLAFLTGSSGVC